MALQLHLAEEAMIPVNKLGSGLLGVTSDLAYMRASIVNVIFFGDPQSSKDWVLIDTGLSTSVKDIIDAAADRFGEQSKPCAIILTHGHFDHTGAVEALVEYWDVPVYAHPLEFPYLTGEATYPPADPWAGGGAMSLLSPLFPRAPVMIRPSLRMLPDDRTLPGMPGWKWLHTPGHTPGHVSLWREHDRMLLAGDAVITTGQESVYEVVVQEPEMHGPPRYFTPNWVDAERSVKLLSALSPETIIAGHGRPAEGELMRARLSELARNFKSIAIPEGRRPDHNRGGRGGHDQG